MANLRTMIDGVGSLELNVATQPVTSSFKPQDDFVYRRKVNRTGPTTHEVLVGKILAMHDDGTAEVSFQKAGGITQRATVDVKQLEPVTEKFKRSSIQYNPNVRPRV